jgi:hypothetical protein
VSVSEADSLVSPFLCISKSEPPITQAGRIYGSVDREVPSPACNAGIDVIDLQRVEVEL